MIRIISPIFFLFFLQGCIRFASKEDENLFIKKYILLKFDGQPCDNCTVDIQENYVYIISMDGKEIDRGKWELGNNLDFPTDFLKIENGPNHMIYSTDSVIDFINR